MRCLLLLLIFTFACTAISGARKGRNSSRKSAASASSNIGRNHASITGLNDVEETRRDLLQSQGDITAQAPAVRGKIRRKLKKRRKSKRRRNGRKSSSQASESRMLVDAAGSKKSEADQENKRREMLKSTLTSMFGFHHINVPRIATGSTPIGNFPPQAPLFRKEKRRQVEKSMEQEDKNPQHSLPHPPDFMLELYRTYSEDQSLMMLQSHSQGNTIRSFFSVQGNSPQLSNDKGKSMVIAPFYEVTTESRRAEVVADLNHQEIKVFAFNVSSIPSTEAIVEAELRLDDHKNILQQAFSEINLENASNIRWTANISVYKTIDSSHNIQMIYQRVSRTITISASSATIWKDLNLAQLASLARHPDHVLIVKFNNMDQLFTSRQTSQAFAGNRSDNDVAVNDAKNVQTTGLPEKFFIVDDKPSKRNSGMNDKNVALPSSKDGMNFSAFVPILNIYCNDSTTITPTSAVSIDNVLWEALKNGNSSAKSTLRIRRSPNTSATSPTEDSDSNELPGDQVDLADTSTSRHVISGNDPREFQKSGSAERDTRLSFQKQEVSAKSRTDKKKKRKRRCRKRKGKKWRRCKKPNDISTSPPASNRVQQACSRKSLHVDFTDIGWENRIIAPKAFDAYYCSGRCEFSQMQDLGSSNHAIIQAFLKSLNMNPEVPPPCCVPETLMPLTMLFFDENANAVIKVLPNMSVKSCACR